MSPLILSLGTRRRWVADVTYRSHYPGLRTPVLNEEDAGWVPQLNWTFWTRHKSLAPDAIPTPDILAHRLQGVPNTLCRLINTFSKTLSTLTNFIHTIFNLTIPVYLYPPSHPLAPSLKLLTVPLSE
jgi:hypothetical protein